MNRRNYQRELDGLIEALSAQERVPTLLIHSCCAPCSSYTLEYLSDYFRITVFYYNPNIYPPEEYDRRIAEQQRLIKALPVKHPVSFVAGPYEPERFYAGVQGLEDVAEGGERCFFCYELRMRKAAVLAKAGGYDYFTTTLSISPLKNAQKINEIGERLAAEYGVTHLPSDFKKHGGYQRSCELSAQYGLYRQNYCGCIYSRMESERRREQRAAKEKGSGRPEAEEGGCRHVRHTAALEADAGAGERKERKTLTGTQKKTLLWQIDPGEMDASKITQAGRIIREGGLVAFPTETVYGLGGDAMNAQASAAIYAAKGRPSDNPLIVHIADIQTLGMLSAELPKAAGQLAKRFWPGPLTMIVRKSAAVPKETTGGLDTVAIRMPAHPVALALIRAAGTPIAAPSANTSGRPSPTTAAHVREDLNGRIDLILDGGRCGIGIESTIIDLTVEPAMILRPGYITRKMLADVLGTVTVDPAVDPVSELTAAGTVLTKTGEADGLRPKAPGMKYRHYAPHGELTIVAGSRTHVTRRINVLVQEAQEAGRRTAVIAAGETAADYRCDRIYTVGTRGEEESIAANLYDILRKLDADGIEVIFSESYAEGELGQAIMNRLLKAAGHRVIDADKEEEERQHDSTGQ